MALWILKRTRLFQLFSVFAVLLVAACAKPETEPVSIPQKKQVAALPSLDRVLTGLTGYGLGDFQRNDNEDDFGKCVAAGRFGATTKGKIVQLFCFSNRKNKPEDRRTKYWVSFTPPEKQHRVWRVEISVPEKKMMEVSLVAELERSIGTPQRKELPLALSWKNETAHLTVKQDDYGTHFLLWDRSLR